MANSVDPDQITEQFDLSGICFLRPVCLNIYGYLNSQTSLHTNKNWKTPSKFLMVFLNRIKDSDQKSIQLPNTFHPRHQRERRTH